MDAAITEDRLHGQHMSIRVTSMSAAAMATATPRKRKSWRAITVMTNFRQLWGIWQRECDGEQHCNFDDWPPFFLDEALQTMGIATELDSSKKPETEGVLLISSTAKDHPLGHRTLSLWAVEHCRQDTCNSCRRPSKPDKKRLENRTKA